MSNLILFIAGPTAVGKSDVALKVVKQIGGEIVSCDAMQVYKEVSIASNKPSKEDRSVCPHHLIDVASVYGEFDVHQYVRLATEVINKIIANGKVPVVVGGSGMYLEALVDGVFEGPKADEQLRVQLHKQAEDEGSESLHKELQEVDKFAADKIHLNDVRRIIRALEVFRLTAKPISQWQKERVGFAKTHDLRLFVLNQERDVLYEKINERVDSMFNQGLEEEVHSLDIKRVSKTASCIIGLRETYDYIKGKVSKEDALTLMKQNTRHYAKRQLTWFRRDKRFVWINKDTQDAVSVILDQ